MTVAMLLLFAGCGGGSSSKSAKTVNSLGGTSREVTAKEGEFHTVIPQAYEHAAEAPVQYWARGPEENGFRTSVIVVREAVRKGDINAYARRIVRAARRAARRISPLQALSVDGVPALAVEYVTEGTQRVRQVMVKHGSWVFLIRDFALPKQYPASLEALDEVIRNWHWQ
jgi:hypothetical protein